MYELNIEKIKTGNEEELKELFEKLLPRLRMIARQSAWHHGEHCNADDLVQDAMLKIYSNLHKFTPERGDFMRWCAVVARNVMIDHLRRESIKKQHVNIDTVEDEKLPLDESQLNIDFASVLNEAIELLPEDQKRIVVERLNGKDYRDIAEELGISAPTVRYKHNLAMAKLKQLILAESKEVNKGVK